MLQDHGLGLPCQGWLFEGPSMRLKIGSFSAVTRDDKRERP